MFQIIKLISILFYLNFMLINHMNYKDSSDIKCMIQMSNYEGEAAYIVISLIDSNGNYEKTLYVQGKDPEWYNEIYEWWKFYGIRRSDLSAISGATISGGERKISIIKIPTNNSENSETNNPPGYTLQVVDIAGDGQHNVIVNSNDTKKPLKQISIGNQ